MEFEFVSINDDSGECSDTVVIYPDDLICSEDGGESTPSDAVAEELNLILRDVDSSSVVDPLLSTPDIRLKEEPTNFDTLQPVCHICKKTFSSTFTRNIHLRTVHTNERPFLCNFCNSRFKRKDHMQKHIQLVHNECRHNLVSQSKKYVPTKYLCAECGKIFCNKTTHQQHVDSMHSKVQKYHCEPCNKSFSRYSKLYRHRVVLNHGINQFSKSCSFCGLEFQSEIYYIRHMTKHEEVKTCEKCKKNFNSNQEFKDHVSETHFEKKKFTCDVCGQAYSNKTSLCLHKRSHEVDDKPFKCEHCGWKFKNKGHLVVHMYRHTGERPYKCDICGKGFKQKGDMRKHKAGHLFNQKKNSAVVKVKNSTNHME